MVITNFENKCRLDTAYKRDLIRDAKGLSRRYAGYIADRAAPHWSVVSLAEGTDEQIFVISVVWPGHLGPTLRRRLYSN